MRIMKTNVDLIKEINKLRLKVKEENKTDKPDMGMRRPGRVFGTDDIENDILLQKEKKVQQKRKIRELLENVRRLESIHRVKPFNIETDIDFDKPNSDDERR